MKTVKCRSYGWGWGRARQSHEGRRKGQGGGEPRNPAHAPTHPRHQCKLASSGGEKKTRLMCFPLCVPISLPYAQPPTALIGRLLIILISITRAREHFIASVQAGGVAKEKGILAACSGEAENDVITVYCTRSWSEE